MGGGDHHIIHTMVCDLVQRFYEKLFSMTLLSSTQVVDNLNYESCRSHVYIELPQCSKEILYLGNWFLEHHPTNAIWV